MEKLTVIKIGVNITDTIWQRVAPLAAIDVSSIMIRPYPEVDESKIDRMAEKEMHWVQQFILGIRKIKGEMNIAPGKRIPVLLADTSEQDRHFAEINRLWIEDLFEVEQHDIDQMLKVQNEKYSALNKFSLIL